MKKSIHSSSKRCERPRWMVGVLSLPLLITPTLSAAADVVPAELPVVRTEVQSDTFVLTGTVVDDQGEPLIGARISLVENTSKGTMTDIDGAFRLPGVQLGQTAEVAFVGYKTQRIKLQSKDALHITLLPDDELLDEVVVVGYGTQKKVNLTGSVASLDTKQLQSRPIQNISNGLQGMLPGVTISSTNGAPGRDGGNIRIRGVGTLNTASPYILIDGVESDNLNSLDPNDIESLSVLKDAASAAIYGSKAANGVILITTKRGKTGAPKITYSGYAGIQRPTNMIERMSSFDYARLYNEALAAEGKAERFTQQELQKFKDGTDPNYPNTNWYDLAYQTGMQHTHNVTMSGGTESVKYMGSIGYMGQKGILPNAGRDKFNGRTNLDLTFSPKLTARLGLSYINDRYTDASSAYAGGSSDQIIRQLNIVAPWIPNKLADGTYGTVSDGNPIAWLESGMCTMNNTQNFAGNLSFDYSFLENLKLTLTGAYINNTNHYKYFQKFIQYNPGKATDLNKLQENYSSWYRGTLDALLNYDLTLSGHTLRAMAGWHAETYNYQILSGERKSFPNNDLTDMDAGDTGTMKNGGYTRELNMLSYFGRLNYDYLGRYLFEANFRADASSRFAKEHRWGYFPSFSLAWRLSEESFMEECRTWLSDLKIRGSWGMLGNQAAFDDYYPALNTYEVGASYPFGGSLSTGYYQGNFKLNTISWEKSTTWGLGLDFALLNNRISGSLDYYDRNTTGIIMDVSVPREFALGAYKDNVGAMYNRGVELSLAYRDSWGDWTFGANANFAYNKNRITDLGGVEHINNVNRVGYAVDSYYLYEADGFFNSQEEADQFTAKYDNPFKKKFMAGDIRYADTNNDGKLDADDRIMTQGTNPVYTFAFGLNGGWRGIDLSLFFNGAAKVARLFDAHEVMGAFTGDNSHPSTIWLDAWRPDNHDASMPRIFTDTNSPSSNRVVGSTFWLQDTSYLRLKNLQLGYTIDSKSLSLAGINSLRVYYSAENLFTIDRMKINVDPEATSQRLSSYPLLQTHSLGVNITF